MTRTEQAKCPYLGERMPSTASFIGLVKLAHWGFLLQHSAWSLMILLAQDEHVLTLLYFHDYPGPGD